MLSLYDLHSQIDELLGINASNSSFSKDLYTDLINGQRSLWIRNEYNKNRSIDPYLEQTLSCLELELVDANTCCTPLPDSCKKLLRTKKKIPNTIEFHHKKGISSVGPVDMLLPRYYLIDYNRVSNIGHGRTTNKGIYAFFFERHIYIFSLEIDLTLLDKITIRGLFEDPTSLGEFINCSSSYCWTPESEYPINQWMWEYIQPVIIQKLLPKLSLKQDDSNNAKDEKTETNVRK